MTDKLRDYEREIQRIVEGMAESVAKASDEEILAEVREEGRDPQAEAERIRATLSNAFKAVQQRGLEEARQRYQESIASMRQKDYDLPQTREARLKLLTDILAKRPEMSAALLTAQHRELCSLTDADVDSLLRQLHELGVIGELARGPEEHEKDER